MTARAARGAWQPRGMTQAGRPGAPRRMLKRLCPTSSPPGSPPLRAHSAADAPTRPGALRSARPDPSGDRRRRPSRRRRSAARHPDGGRRLPAVLAVGRDRQIRHRHRPGDRGRVGALSGVRAARDPADTAAPRRRVADPQAGDADPAGARDRQFGAVLRVRAAPAAAGGRGGDQLRLAAVHHDAVGAAARRAGRAEPVDRGRGRADRRGDRGAAGHGGVLDRRRLSGAVGRHLGGRDHPDAADVHDRVRHRRSWPGRRARGWRC